MRDHAQDLLRRPSSPAAEQRTTPELQVRQEGDNHFWANQDVRSAQDPALMSELGLSVGLGGAADTDDAAPKMKDRLAKVADPFTKGNASSAKCATVVCSCRSFSRIGDCLPVPL